MPNNLITLSEIKAYQGVTNTNGDAELNFLIPKVSAFVKSYIGRTLVDHYTAGKVELFSAVASDLFLKESPINIISSVEYSTDYGKTFIPMEEFVGYARNDEDSSISLIGVTSYTKKTNSVKVTYTGGYSETPADLKLAVLDLLVYYQKAEMAVKSTRAAGANNAQIEYVTNSTIPSHIRRVLDLYRLDL